MPGVLPKACLDDFLGVHHSDASSNSGREGHAPEEDQDHAPNVPHGDSTSPSSTQEEGTNSAAGQNESDGVMC